MGKGKINLKGKRQRPWLEISRSEIDRTYLDHQLRTLRYSHDGPVDYFWDRIATDGFYDKERFRFQGELLWRAYELLYPRDLFSINREALWIDQGRITGKKGSIRGRYSENDYLELESWFNDLSIPAKIHRNNMSVVQLSFKKDSLITLLELINPFVHINMKKTLKQQFSKFR